MQIFLIPVDSAQKLTLVPRHEKFCLPVGVVCLVWRTRNQKAVCQHLKTMLEAICSCSANQAAKTIHYNSFRVQPAPGSSYLLPWKLSHPHTLLILPENPACTQLCWPTPRRPSSSVYKDPMLSPEFLLLGLKLDDTERQAYSHVFNLHSKWVNPCWPVPIAILVQSLEL